MYKNCKIYGPYSRKDERQHVIIIDSCGNRKTVSYPKYLMEIKLNRYLKENETIHHKDKNPLNNNYNNLKVIDRIKHISQDVIKLKPEFFICSICKKEFKLENKKLHYHKANRKRGKVGPFCSRKCAGIYGKRIQMGE